MNFSDFATWFAAAALTAAMFACGAPLPATEPAKVVHDVVAPPSDVLAQSADVTADNAAMAENDVDAGHDVDAAPANPCDDGDPCNVDTPLAAGSCEYGLSLGTITMQQLPNYADQARHLEQFAVAPGNIIYTRWAADNAKLPPFLAPVVAAFDRHGKNLWQYAADGTPNACTNGDTKLRVAGNDAVEVCFTLSAPETGAKMLGMRVIRFVNGKVAGGKAVAVLGMSQDDLNYQMQDAIGFLNGEVLGIFTIYRKGPTGTTTSFAMARVDSNGNLLWAKVLPFVGDAGGHCEIKRLGSALLLSASQVHYGDPEPIGTLNYVFSATGEVLSQPDSMSASGVYAIDSGAAPPRTLAWMDGNGLALHQLAEPALTLPGETIWQRPYASGWIGGLGQPSLVGFWNDGVYFLHGFYASRGDKVDNFYTVYLDSSGQERFRKQVPAAVWQTTGRVPVLFARNRLEIHEAFDKKQQKTSENTALHILDPWGHATCAEAGVCASKTLEECLDTDPCTADDCDPKLGCTHEPLPDDATCNWSTGAKCKKGLCK